MTLTSESQQAVDLLRAPKAISVHLQRRILFRVPQKMLKNPENLHTTQGKDTRDITRAAVGSAGRTAPRIWKAVRRAGNDGRMEFVGLSWRVTPTRMFRGG